MMYSEFDRLCKENDIAGATQEDYKLIEKVYTFHPAFSVNDAKMRAAKMYKTFGVVIFEDMHERAVRIEDAEKRLNDKKTEMENLVLEIERLKEEHMSLMR